MKTARFIQFLLIAVSASSLSMFLRMWLQSWGWVAMLLSFAIMFFPLWYVLSEMDRELHRNGRYKEKMKYSIILLFAVFLSITVLSWFT